MIALVLSKYWEDYYASSPYNNLLNSQHPRFKLFATSGAEIESNQELREQISACEAVVVDDVLSPNLGFYNSGPRLCVGGDLHAHDRKGVEVRTKEFQDNDYVLTGGIFAPELPQYHYIDKSLRRRMIYLPNSTPNEILGLLPFASKPNYAQISGSISREVYPFRYQCSKYSTVERIPVDTVVHQKFFNYISNYKIGITCNSIFDYVVAKYFEIPLVGSLLVAPAFNPVEQELLGFKHGENVYFASSPSDVPRVIDMTFNGSDADKMFAETLATAGQNLVCACHTVTSRLDYIAHVVDMIKLYANFKTEDATHYFKTLREKQQNEYDPSNSNN